MSIQKIKGIDVHPAANIFPLMEGAAYAELVADIREHGQRESCSVYKGQLIDGRNRWLACQELGIEPSVGEFEDDDFDVLGYVLSANLHRRHLSESQRGMVGAEVLAYHKARAKERQKRKPADSVSETFPTQNGRATDEAGAAVGVSGKTVEHAATVLKHGSQELIDAVKADKVSVSKAARIAKSTPKREQISAATAPRKPRKKKPKPQRTAPEPPKPAPKEPESNVIGEGIVQIDDFLNELFSGKDEHVKEHWKGHIRERLEDL